MALNPIVYTERIVRSARLSWAPCLKRRARPLRGAS